MAIARRAQRRLIAAGLRNLPVSRAYFGSKSTGFVDLASTTYNMDTTGSITLLATIPQGASVNSRIGKKITLTSIQMRGNAYSGTTTLTAEGAVLIVYDRRPTGTLPAITDILVSASSRAFNNDDNAGRFKILRRYDNNFIGNTNTAGQSTSKTMYDMDDYIKLNKPAVFKSVGTGVIGDIEQGALYLVTVGTNVAGTTAPILSAGFRVRFKDVQG